MRRRKADCQGSVLRSERIEEPILGILLAVEERVTTIEQEVMEIAQLLQQQSGQREWKEWYSTAEVAEAMDVSQYTVQERWCNGHRIESVKDPDTGKWKIPGREYRRLVLGGALKSKRRTLKTMRQGKEKPEWPPETGPEKS
jgi:hypothetical protein